MPFSPSQSTTWIFFLLKVREFVFVKLNGSEHIYPSLRLNMELICLPAPMYAGDSSYLHSSSEQLTYGLSVSVEKKKTRETAEVFECLSMCVWASWFSWNPSAVWLCFCLFYSSPVWHRLSVAASSHRAWKNPSLGLWHGFHRRKRTAAPSTNLNLILSLFSSQEKNLIPYTMHRPLLYTV